MTADDVNHRVSLLFGSNPQTDDLGYEETIFQPATRQRLAQALREDYGPRVFSPCPQYSTTGYNTETGTCGIDKTATTLSYCNNPDQCPKLQSLKERLTN